MYTDISSQKQQQQKQQQQQMIMIKDNDNSYSLAAPRHSLRNAQKAVPSAAGNL
jgi:hypothetical protein